MVRLPSASSASFVLRFLETMCRHLQCDNLFSSQPFSHYSAYDRSKSGNEFIHLENSHRFVRQSQVSPSEVYCPVVYVHLQQLRSKINCYAVRKVCMYKILHQNQKHPF